MSPPAEGKERLNMGVSEEFLKHDKLKTASQKEKGSMTRKTQN